MTHKTLNYNSTRGALALKLGGESEAAYLIIRQVIPQGDEA